MRTYEQQARVATIAEHTSARRSAISAATAAVNALLTTYSHGDPDWMGSHVHRNMSGCYDTLRANTQVSGWACNAARDTEYNSAAPPTWGRPYCKQWWEDASIALREKLINEADATSAGFSDLVVAIAPAFASEQQNDAVAKTVLVNAPPTWSNNDLVAHYSGSTGLLSTVESVAKGGLASGGLVAASVLFSVTMTDVLQAFPMVHQRRLVNRSPKWRVSDQSQRVLLWRC